MVKITLFRGSQLSPLCGQNGDLSVSDARAQRGGLDPEDDPHRAHRQPGRLRQVGGCYDVTEVLTSTNRLPLLGAALLDG